MILKTLSVALPCLTSGMAPEKCVTRTSGAECMEVGTRWKIKNDECFASCPMIGWDVIDQIRADSVLRHYDRSDMFFLRHLVNVIEHKVRFAR